MHKTHNENIAIYLYLLSLTSFLRRYSMLKLKKKKESPDRRYLIYVKLKAKFYKFDLHTFPETSSNTVRGLRSVSGLQF